jgi:hypothetical protein
MNPLPTGPQGPTSHALSEPSPGRHVGLPTETETQRSQALHWLKTRGGELVGDILWLNKLVERGMRNKHPERWAAIGEGAAQPVLTAVLPDWDASGELRAMVVREIPSIQEVCLTQSDGTRKREPASGLHNALAAARSWWEYCNWSAVTEEEVVGLMTRSMVRAKLLRPKERGQLLMACVAQLEEGASKGGSPRRELLWAPMWEIFAWLKDEALLEPGDTEEAVRKLAGVLLRIGEQLKVDGDEERTRLNIRAQKLACAGAPDVLQWLESTKLLTTKECVSLCLPLDFDSWQNCLKQAVEIFPCAVPLLLKMYTGSDEKRVSDIRLYVALNEADSLLEPRDWKIATNGGVASLMERCMAPALSKSLGPKERSELLVACIAQLEKCVSKGKRPRTELLWAPLCKIFAWVKDEAPLEPGDVKGVVRKLVDVLLGIHERSRSSGDEKLKSVNISAQQAAFGQRPDVVQWLESTKLLTTKECVSLCLPLGFDSWENCVNRAVDFPCALHLLLKMDTGSDAQNCEMLRLLDQPSRWSRMDDGGKLLWGEGCRTFIRPLFVKGRAGIQSLLNQRTRELNRLSRQMARDSGAAASEMGGGTPRVQPVASDAETAIVRNPQLQVLDEADKAEASAMLLRASKELLAGLHSPEEKCSVVLSDEWQASMGRLLVEHRLQLEAEVADLFQD